MAEPVGPLPELPSYYPQAVPKTLLDVPSLCKKMQDQVLVLAEHLQKVFEDPTLATHQMFLSDFASNASKLNQTVDQAAQVR